MLAALLALTLLPPVDGAVARAFDYGWSPYVAGQHRGVDLTARPGEPVRAPCGGRVAFAGRIPGGDPAVTVACGRYRVTLVGARSRLRMGEKVRAGRPIATAAPGPGHHGLHLGVRRADDRHGYVDPTHFLRTSPPPSMPVVGPASRIERPRPAPRVERPRPSRPAADPPGASAPWPAWLGAGLGLLALAAGASGRARRRADNVKRPWPSTSPRRSTT